jgi:hypothetical protein
LYFGHDTWPAHFISRYDIWEATVVWCNGNILAAFDPTSHSFSRRLGFESDMTVLNTNAGALLGAPSFMLFFVSTLDCTQVNCLYFSYDTWPVHFISMYEIWSTRGGDSSSAESCFKQASTCHQCLL